MKRLANHFWQFIKRLFGFGDYSPQPKNTVLWKHQESDLLERINKYRAENGKTLLQKDDTHYKLADERILDCFEEGGISHKKFPLAAGFLYGLNYRGSSENLAHGQKDGPAMFKAWTYSAGHDKNLLGNYRYTGICLKRDHRGVLYGCQIFSR
jgi:uncharacterized protein YkwD